MKKMISLNIVTILIVTFLFYVVCYILLKEKDFKVSISSIIMSTHHIQPIYHLLVLGLLPIYIAAIVFGTALLGVYIGSLIQLSLSRFISKIKQPAKKPNLSNLPSYM